MNLPAPVGPVIVAPVNHEILAFQPTARLSDGNPPPVIVPDPEGFGPEVDAQAFRPKLANVNKTRFQFEFFFDPGVELNVPNGTEAHSHRACAG